MKLLAKVIMVIAMMCTGVQVYAQYHRPAPRYHHPHYYSSYQYRPHHYVSYSAYVWYPRYGYWYYAPLKTYVYGDRKRPEKVKVDVVEFKRTSSGMLRIKNGTVKSELDMYDYHHLKYTCPSGISIDLLIDDGSAKITVYDSAGEIVEEHTL